MPPPPLKVQVPGKGTAEYKKPISPVGEDDGPIPPVGEDDGWAGLKTPTLNPQLYMNVSNNPVPTMPHTAGSVSQFSIGVGTVSRRGLTDVRAARYCLQQAQSVPGSGLQSHAVQVTVGQGRLHGAPQSARLSQGPLSPGGTRFLTIWSPKAGELLSPSVIAFHGRSEEEVRRSHGSPRLASPHLTPPRRAAPRHATLHTALLAIHGEGMLQACCMYGACDLHACIAYIVRGYCVLSRMYSTCMLHVFVRTRCKLRVSSCMPHAARSDVTLQDTAMMERALAEAEVRTHAPTHPRAHARTHAQTLARTHARVHAGGALHDGARLCKVGCVAADHPGLRSDLHDDRARSTSALSRRRRRHVHCTGVGVLVLKMTADVGHCPPNTDHPGLRSDLHDDCVRARAYVRVCVRV